MKQLLLLACVPLLFSCGGDTKPKEEIETIISDSMQMAKSNEEKMANSSGLTGYYVGEFEAADVKPNRTYFYKNKINISIDTIDNGKIIGHSVVAGNNRPFTGTYKMDGANYVIEAKEPGDDKYDGIFNFTIDPQLKTVSGTWTANNAKLEVNKRKYTLSTAIFKYDPNNVLSTSLIGDVLPEWKSIAQLQMEDDPGYDEIITEDAMKYNASVVKLTSKDVENMYKGDLEILRNTIYARHGYSFKNRKMRYIFDTKVDWYIPVTTDIRAELTDIEKQNVELIKRYEEHALKYYDSFGR